MKMSESIDKLVQAMVKFQSLVPTIKKESQGYGYKYADLSTIMSTIRPILSECGLCVTQNPHYNEEGNMIGISTHVEHVSGQYKYFDPVMIPINERAKNVAQEVGTDVTYARRYSLSCALNLVTDEDTDGVKPDPKPKKKYENKTEHSPKKENKKEYKKSNEVDLSPWNKLSEENKVCDVNEKKKRQGRQKLVALCKTNNISDDERYKIIEQETNKKSSKDLTLDELRHVYRVIREEVRQHA